jgi:uncharacterized repeat protein (TIGR03803 family)
MRDKRFSQILLHIRILHRQRSALTFLGCAAVLLLCGASAFSQTFTTLLNLGKGTGTYTGGWYAQGRNGDLYGSTENGGAYGWGTIFGITPAGRLVSTFSFDGYDGNGNNKLVLGYDGSLYGTYWNSYSNQGGIFKITTEGTLTDLHTFSGSDGAIPNGTLALGRDGNFYGTTQIGGTYNFGTIFKISPEGDFTSLLSFDGSNGANPGGLTLGTDGNFYGFTVASAKDGKGNGTAFEYTAAGVLIHFCKFATNEDFPDAVLVEDSNSNFYGALFDAAGNVDGSIYKVTTSGTCSTFYSFSGADGANPSGFIMGTDGNFYGVTLNGGTYGFGTIYQMTTGGVLATLHSFDETDGNTPYGLTQHTNGTFYGSTAGGGLYGGDSGTIYSLNMGLAPFASLLPNSGTPGKTIEMLGQGFTGTTAVSFNGVSASFTVVSDTLLEAVVPAGVTSGPVTVTTPGGVLTSNGNFIVP